MCDESRDRLYLALIILFAALIRLMYIPFNDVIEVDGVEYAVLAQNLLAGKGYVGLYHSIELLFPPLFPIMIAGVTLLTKDVELSARIISSMLGALTILPVFLLTKEIYNRRAAFIAAVVVGAYPFMILASASTFSESPYTFFLTYGIYAFYMSLKTERWRYSVLTGFLLALGYLIKPEEVYFMLVMVIINFVVIAFKKVTENKSVFKPAIMPVALLASFILLAFPYINFLKNHTGRYMLEGKSSVNYIIAERMSAGMSSREAHYGLDGEGNPMGILPDHNMYAATYNYNSFVTSVPQLLKTMAANVKPIYKKFPLVVVTPLVIALIFYGLFRTRWDKKRLYGEMFLGVFVALQMAFIFLHIMIERYFVPMMPIALIWTAVGVSELYGWFTEHESHFLRKPAVQRGFLALAIIITLASNLVVFMTYTVYDEGKVKEAKIAAKWLNENGRSPRKVMAGHSQVAFYSDSFYFLTPFARDDLILKYARNYKIDYIVVDERYIDDIPQIARWYTDQSDPAGLKLVFKDNSIKGAGIKVYEVLPEL